MFPLYVVDCRVERMHVSGKHVGQPEAGGDGCVV